MQVFTNEFWNMGGYAVYVWPAFGITLGVMLVLGIMVVHSHRNALRDVRRRMEVEK